jgi:hypothetical protein
MAAISVPRGGSLPAAVEAPSSCRRLLGKRTLRRASATRGCSIKVYRVIDLDRLLKLRLVVARHGEMDRAGWWNTQGMLGQLGETAVQRGLPRTHRFARARVVFAVARSRCQELFDPPDCVTLWKLPADIENEFEEHWHSWLAANDEWSPLIDELAASKEPDLLAELASGNLISSEEIEALRAMRRSAEGRTLQLQHQHQMNDGLVTLLAGGFAKGEHGAPTIPYAKLAG